MYEEIYIDVVFVTNLLTDYILLRLTAFLLRCRAGRGRCLIAAAAGALFSCLLLYIPIDGSLPVFWLLHGACALGMLKGAFAIRQGSLLLKALAVFYLTAFLTGGFWEAVAGDGLSLFAFLVVSLAVYLGIGALLAAADAARASRAHIYPVTLSYRGRERTAYGFYDTGNLLTDPVSGEPVSVMEAALLDEMLSKDLADRLKHLQENPGELKSTEIAGLRPHYLPCRTVGTETGLLLAVTLENLCIHTPGKEVRISEPVLALADESSALGKEYKVLLNSRLLH